MHSLFPHSRKISLTSIHRTDLRWTGVFTGMRLQHIPLAIRKANAEKNIEKVSWRWCFFINLPACAVIAVVVNIAQLSVLKMKKDLTTHRNRCVSHTPRSQQWPINHGSRKLRPSISLGTFDIMTCDFSPDRKHANRKKTRCIFSVAALLPGLVTLLLALQWGGSRYSWSNARVVALIVIGVVLLCVFAILQLTQPPSRATIQPRIISQRTVLFSAILAFCMGASFLVLVFYLPLWFQAVKGEDAMNSGFMILPILLGVVILGLLGGGFVSLIGYYVPSMILGTVLLSIGSGLLTTLTVDSPKSKWVGFQACAGMGIGLALQQPMVAIQTVLDGDRMSGDLPGGIAIIAFVQTMGGALFISV